MFRTAITSMFLVFCFIVQGQEASVTEINNTTFENPEVPFEIIEKVPVYPGCDEETNAALKKCMSDKISAFIGANFNLKKIQNSDIPAATYRILVKFKVNKKGKVTSVKARARYPFLEKEAIRTIKELPQMEPGEQKGKKVNVLYALPIVFEVVKDTSPQKTKKNQ